MPVALQPAGRGLVAVVGVSADHPNHVKLQRGEIVTGFAFGPVRSVQPIHFPGFGHKPHVECRFEGGVRVDLTPQDLVALIRQATEALAKLPAVPDFSDHVGGQE